MNIIITMAGEGTRFKNARYNLPKHMITIKDKTMFEWAMQSLKEFFDEKLIFVTFKKNNDYDFIREKCKKLGIKNYHVFSLDETTNGQAETALLCKKLIAPKEEIMIYNIDTYVETGEIRKEKIKGDGWIPCFEDKGDHWSFLKFNSDLRIYEITEKKKISDYASIGLYYFRDFLMFEYAMKDYYSKNRELKERYIAPIYNVLIEEGKEIFTTILNKERIHVLGTPEEVMIFEKENKR